MSIDLSGLASDSNTETPAAVALFVARAQAADPRLQPTGAQIKTIADICRRLDGMPLAIELAAARVRLLGVDGVRARLDERFNILTGGTRSVLTPSSDTAGNPRVEPSIAVS